MEDDSKYPSTADVLERLVLPRSVTTRVGSHRRPASAGSALALHRGLVRRRAQRLLGPIVGGPLTTRAAVETDLWGVAE